MDSFRCILYVYKRTSSGPRDGKRIRKPVAEALGGVMARPVGRRHIIIIQARLVHRSRLADRTPSCDVSAFPRSRVMCARSVTSMLVHSTQPGEPLSSDIPTLRARWNPTSLCMYGTERLKRFFSKYTQIRMGPRSEVCQSPHSIRPAWDRTNHPFLGLIRLFAYH